jgi:hypothetical protein
VGFLVDKVALGHVSLRVLGFFLISIIPPVAQLIRSLFICQELAAPLKCTLPSVATKMLVKL